jgi:hypothetical protein
VEDRRPGPGRSPSAGKQIQTGYASDIYLRWAGAAKGTGLLLPLVHRSSWRVGSYDTPKIRFIATLGQEPEVEVALG